MSTQQYTLNSYIINSACTDCSIRVYGRITHKCYENALSMKMDFERFLVKIGANTFFNTETKGDKSGLLILQLY